MRNAIISFIVVLVTVMLIVFISKEIEKISDSVSLNHKLQAELTNRSESLKILNRDMQIIGENDNKIETAFIPADNILNFVSELDKLANKNNLIQIYRFETPASSNLAAPFPIGTISYSNNFTSNVSTFSSYLKEFENLPYFTKIDNINISSQDKAGWTNQSNISYKATLYTKKIQ
jgi:hypothetical protein